MIFISIHALRGEGDVIDSVAKTIRMEFQSTPSVGRATLFRLKITLSISISIHALRGEGDQSKAQRKRPNQNFNPRPPWGGRQLPTPNRLEPFDFNPRPPWGGRLVVLSMYDGIATISIHALRGEGDSVYAIKRLF